MFQILSKNGLAAKLFLKSKTYNLTQSIQCQISIKNHDTELDEHISVLKQKSLISHSEFIEVLKSIPPKRPIPHEKLYSIKNYLQSDQLLGKPKINQVISKVSYIDNPDLFGALEKNVQTNISTANLIQNQKERDDFARFTDLRNKAKKLSMLNLKVFAVATLITFVFRVYYYIEHDIDILEPRVSSYHIYRFR